MDNQKEKFSVYKHRLLYGRNDELIVEKKFIVLMHADGTMSFTDFHRYAVNPDRKVKKFNDNGNNRAEFICKFLNYAFFTAGINALSEITVDIGKAYLNAYGKYELEGDDEFTSRSKGTIDRCVQVILDFYINVINDKHSGCRISLSDLYTTVTKRNKHGQVVKKKIPVFDVRTIPTTKVPIFRDMPNKAFELIMDHIVEHHRNLLGLVMVQAFAGVRPSEACNVRRADSPLGAGIRMKTINGRLSGVEIDLTNEMNLRSDRLSVGGIKKERTAEVPDIFLSIFKDCYDLYMEYMEGRPYEAEYGPFSVNQQGKAITYDSYYGKFRRIVREEMVPIFLSSDDPELVLYGHTLMEHSLGPHVLRHWFTVQLVLSGIERNTLAWYRGDASEDTANFYLQQKGDLEKKYSKITNETFAYIQWAARKKYHERI